MTKLGKAVEKQIAIFQLYMTHVAFFDILLIQKSRNAVPPMLGGITVFTTGGEYRKSHPIPDNHALNFSYLCNYQYCTTLNMFMCLHMNICWEVDLGLTTSLGAAWTSSGCLWRGHSTNTQATNQRDMTCFYYQATW